MARITGSASPTGRKVIVSIKIKVADVISATSKMVRAEWVDYELDSDGILRDDENAYVELPDTSEYVDGQPYVIKIGNLDKFEFELSGDTTLADIYDDYADREVSSAVNLRDRIAVLTEDVVAEGLEIDANRDLWRALGTVDFDNDTISGINAEKIADGTVDNDAFEHIHDLTDDAQAQISAVNTIAQNAATAAADADTDAAAADAKAAAAQSTADDAATAAAAADAKAATAKTAADNAAIAAASARTLAASKLTVVATDDTLTGDGQGDALSVANPFTEDDESHLDALPPLWTPQVHSVGSQVTWGMKVYSCVTERSGDDTDDPATDTTGWAVLGTGTGSGGATYTAGTGLTLDDTEFNVDDPYSAAEKAKLAAIEAGATADQTGQEMVTAITALTGADRLGYTALKDTPDISGVRPIEGVTPQAITTYATASTSVAAGLFTSINVTAQDDGAYFEKDSGTNNISIKKAGTYRLYGNITVTNGDRSGPSFDAVGTGVAVIGYNNPYVRDADTDTVAARTIDFTVAADNTVVSLRVMNRIVHRSSFPTAQFTIDALEDLAIIPVGGMVGPEGPAGSGGGTTIDASNRLNADLVGTGVVNNAEFNTLNNARSELQHQIDGNKAEADGNKDALEELFTEVQLVGSYAWTSHGPPQNANEISLPLANTVYVRSDGTNYMALADVIVPNVLLILKTAGKEDKKFRVVFVTKFASTHVLQLSGHYEVDGGTFASGDSIEIHVEDIDASKIGELAFKNPPTLSNTEQANVRSAIGAGSGGSGISGVEVKDEGTALTTEATGFNFTGRLVTASGNSAEKKVHVEGVDAQTFTFDRLFVWATPTQARQLQKVYLSWDGSGFWGALDVSQPTDPTISQPIEIILPQGLAVPSGDFALYNVENGKIMDLLQTNKQTGTSGNVNSAGKWIVDQKDSLNDLYHRHSAHIHERALASTTFTKAEAAVIQGQIKAMQAEWHELDDLARTQVSTTWTRHDRGNTATRGVIVLNGGSGSFTTRNTAEYEEIKPLINNGDVLIYSKDGNEAVQRIHGVVKSDSFEIISFSYDWIAGGDNTVGAVGTTGIVVEVQEVNEQGIARISYNTDIFDTLYLNVSAADVQNLIGNVLSFDNVNTWVPEGHSLQPDNNGFLVGLAVPNGITIPPTGNITITPGVGAAITFARADQKASINAIGAVGDWYQTIVSRRDLNTWNQRNLNRKLEGIAVQEEGTKVGADATSLDFVGTNVTVTGDAAAKTVTITAPSGVSAAQAAHLNAIPPAWAGLKAYAIGDQVVYNDRLYIARAIIADTVNTNPSADAARWSPVGRALRAVEQGKLDDGPAKWAAGTHTAGDMAVWDGKVYECISDRTGGDTGDPASDTAGWRALNGATGGGGSGEDNVQADWDETNTGSDAYIRGKPTDAEIGDKAFSNPPSDLTPAEQTAVRSRIGAGDAHEHTASYTAEFTDANTAAQSVDIHCDNVSKNFGTGTAPVTRQGQKVRINAGVWATEIQARIFSDAGKDIWVNVMDGIELLASFPIPVQNPDSTNGEVVRTDPQLVLSARQDISLHIYSVDAGTTTASGTVKVQDFEWRLSTWGGNVSDSTNIRTDAEVGTDAFTNVPGNLSIPQKWNVAHDGAGIDRYIAHAMREVAFTPIGNLTRQGNASADGRFTITAGGSFQTRWAAADYQTAKNLIKTGNILRLTSGGRVSIIAITGAVTLRDGDRRIDILSNNFVFADGSTRSTFSNGNAVVFQVYKFNSSSIEVAAPESRIEQVTFANEIISNISTNTILNTDTFSVIRGTGLNRLLTDADGTVTDSFNVPAGAYDLHVVGRFRCDINNGILALDFLNDSGSLVGSFGNQYIRDQNQYNAMEFSTPHYLAADANLRIRFNAGNSHGAWRWQDVRLELWERP